MVCLSERFCSKDRCVFASFYLKYFIVGKQAYFSHRQVMVTQKGNAIYWAKYCNGNILHISLMSRREFFYQSEMMTNSLGKETTNC